MSVSMSDLLRKMKLARSRSLLRKGIRKFKQKKKKSRSVRFAPSQVLLIEKRNRSKNKYSHKLGGYKHKVDEEIVGRHRESDDTSATKIQSLFRGFRSRKQHPRPHTYNSDSPYQRQHNGRYEWHTDNVMFSEENFKRLREQFNIHFFNVTDEKIYLWKNPDSSIFIGANTYRLLTPTTVVMSCTSPELLSQFIYVFQEYQDITI